jgi:hypothetical protein
MAHKPVYLDNGQTDGMLIWNVLQIEQRKYVIT